MKKDDLTLGLVVVIIIYLVMKVVTFDFDAVKYHKPVALVKVQKEAVADKIVIEIDKLTSKVDIPAVNSVMEMVEKVEVSEVVNNIKNTISEVKVDKIIEVAKNKVDVVKEAVQDAIQKVKTHFQRHNDLVVDTNTNLMWQDNSDVKNITKPYITGKNYYLKDFNNTKGDTAYEYCNSLTLGGYNDFRLPTIKELKTLVNHKDETFMFNIFQNITRYNYWSSSTPNDDERSNLYLYTTLGSIDTHNKSYNLYVRCVRDK